MVDLATVVLDFVSSMQQKIIFTVRNPSCVIIHEKSLRVSSCCTLKQIELFLATCTQHCKMHERSVFFRQKFFGNLWIDENRVIISAQICKFKTSNNRY